MSDLHAPMPDRSSILESGILGSGSPPGPCSSCGRPLVRQKGVSEYRPDEYRDQQGRYWPIRIRWEMWVCRDCRREIWHKTDEYSHSGGWVDKYWREE